MKRIAWAASALAIMALVTTVAVVQGQEATPQGKQVFEELKCNMCHAVSTVGIEAKTTSEKLKGPDLVDLAKSYDAEWIAKYVKKEADKEGEQHKKEFKGSDEELQALVDWLLEQKAEG